MNTGTAYPRSYVSLRARRAIGVALAALLAVALLLASGCGGESERKSGDFNLNPGAGTYGIGF